MGIQLSFLWEMEEREWNVLIKEWKLRYVCMGQGEALVTDKFWYLLSRRNILSL